MFPIGILLYALSRYAWYTGTPRYLFVLYPAVSVLAAGAATGILHWTRTRRGRLLRASGLAIVGSAALLFVVASAVGIGENKAKGNQQRLQLTTDAEIRAADRWLLDHGYHAAYAEYWTALPAEFFAPDGLHVAPTNIGKTKAAYARKQVDSSRRFVYMASARVPVNYAKELVQAFADHHVRYRVVRLDGVTLYTDLSPELRPGQLDLRS